MTNSDFKDHFSGNSDGYAAYRPSYPAALINVLADISPAQHLALDCGCGTGQLSVLLADRFEKVVATDASAAQISRAHLHGRVTFRVALAHESGLPDASVDLITVAQAAHWLDLEKLYEETRRIARPQAVIALISYGILHVKGEVDADIQRFYHEALGPYWPPERQHVENGYHSLPFPFEELELPELRMEAQWRLEHLIGYLNTWSAVKAAEQVLGQNPVTRLAETLREKWGNPIAERRVIWPLSLRVGRVTYTA